VLTTHILPDTKPSKKTQSSRRTMRATKMFLLCLARHLGNLELQVIYLHTTPLET
jgi:hypothetical protein